MEAAFIESRRETLLLNMSRAAILTFVAYGIIMIRDGLLDPTHPEPIRIMLTWSVGIVMLVSLAVALGLRSAWCAHNFRGAKVEFAFGLLIVLLVLTTLVTDELFLQLAYNEKMACVDAWQQYGYLSTKALILDAMVTFVHLALPLRWVVAAWIDIVVIFVIFTFAWMNFGPFSQCQHFPFFVVPAQNLLITFFLIIVGSLVGLRSQEKTTRRLFTTIADERTMRAQAEFRAQTQSVVAIGAGACQHDSESSYRGSKVSVPRTTATGELFQRIQQEVDTIAKLEDLGRREQWLLNAEHLEVSEVALGAGACGTVLAGSFCQSPVAIKVVNERTDSGRTTLLNELRILRHVRHPNIALFHGACLDPETLSILLVLERIDGRPLHQVVMDIKAWQRASPQTNQQAGMMIRLCHALLYLHSREPCIVHGDLKPDNILVQEQGGGLSPKLLDFGLSRLVTQGARLNGGTPVYVAPEVVLCTGRPSCAADVFSLGRVLFFVASGRRPLASYKGDHVLASIRSKMELSYAWAPITDLLAKWRPTIQSCADPDPAQRPTVMEVLDILKQTQPGSGGAAGKPQSEARQRVPGPVVQL